jgi:hypothetical protein
LPNCWRCIFNVFAKKIKDDKSICQTPGDAHLQEFPKFYLVNLVFCQLLKRYAK